MGDELILLYLVISIQSRAKFMEALPSIAATSKEFFLMSSHYFNSETSGYVQVILVFLYFKVADYLPLNCIHVHMQAHN